MDAYEHQNALEFSNVYFNYSSKSSKDHLTFTLSGVNLCVPKGGIYGLLGSSGCGKTTLLRCSLGRLTPQYGTILLFGKTPGSKESNVPGPGVGYMPQELALFLNFTIEETLQYFGRIFGINEDTVEERIKFLVKLLQLPNRKKLICKLSGGQQRRVSLAAALFHSPPLLILDEPTVGVDPLLREAIWLHLESLCKSGLTVILTTHYIEEARAARVVGFMRSGKLLAEGTPDELLRVHETHTLETVFLKLCRVDNTMDVQKERLSIKDTKLIPQIEINEDGLNHCMNEPAICLKIIPREFNQHQDCINDDSTKLDVGIINTAYKSSTNSIETISIASKDMNYANGHISTNPLAERQISGKRSIRSRMSALMKKNLKQLCRNFSLLSFFVVLPSVEITLLILSIGQDPKNIPLAVYNPETPANLAYQFLCSIDREYITLVNYSDLDSAINAVKRNEAWAAISFYKNFSESFKTRQASLIFDSDTDAGFINSSLIRLYVDMSNQVIGFQIQRLVFDAFMKFLQFISRDLPNPDVIKSPISIEPPIYGERHPSLTSFIAPGALIVVAYFATTVVTCHLLIKEHHDGLVERSLVAGVTAIEFIASHVIVQIAILTTQIALKLIIAFAIFGIPLKGSLIAAVALILGQGICGLMFGLMVSAACPDEIYATTLGIGTFFPSVIVGGIFWPLESMPDVLRYISYLLPSTLPIESLRSILLRGWGINYHQVAIGFVVTSLWFWFFLICAIIFFRQKL